MGKERHALRTAQDQRGDWSEVVDWLVHTILSYTSSWACRQTTGAHSRYEVDIVPGRRLLRRQPTCADQLCWTNADQWIRLGYSTSTRRQATGCYTQTWVSGLQAERAAVRGLSPVTTREELTARGSGIILIRAGGIVNRQWCCRSSELDCRQLARC